MDSQAFRQSAEILEQRYRILLRRTSYAHFRAAPDGQLLEVNPALARMLGYESEVELSALGCATAFHLDPHDATALLHDAAGPADPAPWLELRWKKKDGTPISVRASAQRLHGNGGADEIEVLAEDVTERRRQDELMRRTERMASLGTTLAGVAHELNNPLAAIMGFAQLLLKKPLSDEDRASLETINHEAIRSAKIVKDLLTLARSKEVERRAPMNLNDIAGYILRTRRYALETYGIACELRLDPSIPPVRGDRTQLEQVVLNLIANAEQALRSVIDDPSDGAARPHARIVVGTRREGNSVLLEVEDNGPGIPEEAQPRIWDPFWTTKEGSEGTGLGLSVVDHIVAEHGGSIHVESVAGAGARFVVRLPALPTSPRDQDLRDGVSSDQAAHPLDVLVVDPEPRNLSFLTKFLTSRGHAVLAANEGHRALHLAAHLTFDAIICDAAITESGNGSVAAALRRLPGCASARFVVSTTQQSGDVSARIAAELPFVAAVVGKPYDIEALRQLIEEP